MMDAYRRAAAAIVHGVAGAVLAVTAAQAAATRSGTPAGVEATVEATVESGAGVELDAAARYPEIVVTAQKRPERLRDVPAAVSVLAAGALTRQGVVAFADYATRIPGLSLTSARTGNTQVTLRGITTGAAQPGSTTGFYVDEAPVGSVNAYTGGNGVTPDLDPSDLVQIEVLKGPQGTLYGAGAVGGLVKFVSQPVDLDAVGGRASAGITAVSRGEPGFAWRGVVNLPIVAGRAGLRVSGVYRRDGGYIDTVGMRTARADANRVTLKGGRAALAIELAPGLRLDLSALGQNTHSDAANLADVDAATLAPLRGDLTAARFVAEPGEQRLRLYNATFRAGLGAIDLLASTTYQRISFDEVADVTRSYGAALGPLLGFATDLGVRLDTSKRTARWSQEARASASGLLDGALDLQAGLYWTREEDENRIPGSQSFDAATGAALTLPLPVVIAAIDSTYEEYSLFANARIRVGDAFDVLGGIRFSHDRQTYLQDYRGLIVGPARLIALGRESADVTTWLVSPRYRMSDDLMVYARVATGYRPGGPNPAPPTGAAPLTFAPDRLTQYELGLKAQAPDRRWAIEAALFHTDWHDVQIQTSGGGFNYLVNGGQARSRGGELTLRYRPIPGLSFDAAGSFVDARLTAAAPAAGGLDRDRLPYVPRWSGSLATDYTRALGPNLVASVGGTLSVVSSRISDYARRLPGRLPGYATLDLRAGLAQGNLSLSVFARNLADRRAITVQGPSGLAPSVTPGAVAYAAYIAPRTIGAEAAIRF
jgi:outer membrane receptor protein involved in Fe transport